MQGTTRSHKPKDSDIDKQCCDNLKSDDSRVVYKYREEMRVRKKKGGKSRMKGKETLKDE